MLFLLIEVTSVGHFQRGHTTFVLRKPFKKSVTCICKIVKSDYELNNVCLSAQNNLAPNRQIVIKFDI